MNVKTEQEARAEYVMAYNMSKDRGYLKLIMENITETKKEQLIKACERNEILTSTYGLGHCYIFLSNEGGLYIKMTGTRSSWSCYIKPDGSVGRAPKIDTMREVDFFQPYKICPWM